MEFPRLNPNFVNRYRGASFGLYRYQADSRIETRTAVGCYGANASFELRFEGLEVPEMGQIIDFWREVEYDFDAGMSLYSFDVPKNHPVWRKVRVLHKIEESVLHADSVDEARWILRDADEIDVELCGIHSWSCRIEEVIE